MLTIIILYFTGKQTQVNGKGLMAHSSMSVQVKPGFTSVISIRKSISIEKITKVRFTLVVRIGGGVAYLSYILLSVHVRGHEHKI